MTTIAGRRVLVVEDDGIAAMALCELLELAGAEVVGPAATVAKAAELARTSEVDVALLDVDLSGHPSYGVAALLRQRGVPVVFVTGHEAASLPPELSSCAVLTKPTCAADVCDTLARALAPGQRDPR